MNFLDQFCYQNSEVKMSHVKTSADHVATFHTLKWLRDRLTAWGFIVVVEASPQEPVDFKLYRSWCYGKYGFFIKNPQAVWPSDIITSYYCSKKSAFPGLCRTCPFNMPLTMTLAMENHGKPVAHSVRWVSHSFSLHVVTCCFFGQPRWMTREHQNHKSATNLP